ncbi:ABC transporter substrate-binding protein [Caldibacillus thermolactis]|jgi:oligopeptide transport system substrate-binding protein|uniref:ABC transporter substrate-binding protein n=1 Tax=Pallidibacillus thermolactis TaxID=251051 RepID=A0ABT2WHA4_9BACI|nr:ABC transporter substrate-binding protein [Pallidibacillus thermolactis]MCU9594807.1 ABC transporter substrate-binding protein [Pallidibacillus thermolactis]
MRTKKWSILLVAVLVVSMVLAACGGGKDEGSTKNSSGEDAAKAEEQVLNFINGDYIPSMDPSKVTDEYGFQFVGATMEGLYRLGEDGEIKEGIAKGEPEVSEDGLTWTFKLREDAKWSNGDPVTAHDFVYSWQRAVKPETKSEYGPYMMAGVIKNADEISKGELPVEELGVKAIDDYTLEVQLANPTPYFESLTTFGTFMPLNQKFVEEHGENFATSEATLLFNGPFKLDIKDDNQNITQANEWKLVKNEDYWDADTVQLEEINFVVSKDPQTNVNLYNEGDIDRADLSADLVDQYISHDDYRIVPQASVFYLKMNQERKGEQTPLANKNIRNAINNAIDREALVNVLNNGSIAATGLIPKDFVTVPGGGDFREENGDFAAYDKDTALEAWNKGLEELGVDSIELELLTDDAEGATKTFNENLAHQLETNLPGLKVNIKPVPFKNRLQLDTDQDYELQVAGWGPDYLDPFTFLSLFVTDGGNNKMGYSNAEYDQLISETQTTTDQEQRYQKFLEAEKILLEESGIAPLYQRARSQLHSPKIQGEVINKFGATYEWKWAYVAE